MSPGVLQISAAMASRTSKAQSDGPRDSGLRTLSSLVRRIDRRRHAFYLQHLVSMLPTALLEEIRSSRRHSFVALFNIFLPSQRGPKTNLAQDACSTKEPEAEFGMWSGGRTTQHRRDAPIVVSIFSCVLMSTILGLTQVRTCLCTLFSRFGGDSEQSLFRAHNNQYWKTQYQQKRVSPVCVELPGKNVAGYS